MKDGRRLEDLLKELARDPRLKRLMSKHRARGKAGVQIENITEILLVVLALASRFASKKRARALDELMDSIYLLVQVSVLVKENVFDRPEVSQFFSRRGQEIYSRARKFVSMVLPGAKGLR